MNHRDPGVGGASGYLIRTRGHIGERWSEWFEGMTLVHEEHGTTVICAPELDQAGLHGLLAKVRDLGLPLISVTAITTDLDTVRRSFQR